MLPSRSTSPPSTPPSILQRPVTSFDDTHAQDVAQVAFHPVHRSILVSGSEDGLIAVFDTAPQLGEGSDCLGSTPQRIASAGMQPVAAALDAACARRCGPQSQPLTTHCFLPCPPVPAPADEDEGFKAALNIDTSVAKLGFYGQQGERLWARSGVESLHLWEWAAACNDEAAGVRAGLGRLGRLQGVLQTCVACHFRWLTEQIPAAPRCMQLHHSSQQGPPAAHLPPPAGGNGALGEALNAREQLTAAAAACPVGQALAPGLDYLIGCEYNAAANQLWLLAGNNGGAVGFYPVIEPPAGTVQQQQQQAGAQPAPLFGHPQAALLGGSHTDVVRSVLWPGAAGSLCLTGGEDSKICVWSTLPQAAATGAQQRQQQGAGGSREGGAVRKHQQPPHGRPHAAQQQHQRRAAPY